MQIQINFTAALMGWLVLHFADKLVNAWLGSGRAHFWSRFAIILFLALFFIFNSAEKHASHSQVNEKGIKSWIAVLATLEYEATIAD